MTAEYEYYSVYKKDLTNEYYVALCILGYSFVIERDGIFYFKRPTTKNYVY